MQEPPAVDGELLGFGTGQQHAVVERMQETRLADPAFFFNQLRMHERDLAGGSAKADATEF